VDKLLSLLGLAKKAGRLELGEEPVGNAARVHGVRLLLLSSDAADNTARRARRFAQEGSCLLAQLPADKAALGRATGRSSCAMLAVTDIGFAAAIAKKLSELDADAYGDLAQRLSVKAARAAERKDPERRRRREKPRKSRPAVTVEKRREASDRRSGEQERGKRAEQGNRSRASTPQAKDRQKQTQQRRNRRG